MIYKRLAELSEVITPTYGLHGTIIENGQKFISVLLNLFLRYICEVSKASQSMFWLETIDEVSIIIVRHYVSEVESYYTWRLKLVIRSCLLLVIGKNDILIIDKILF